jgi:hypothetical protein
MIGDVNPFALGNPFYSPSHVHPRFTIREGGKRRSGVPDLCKPPGAGKRGEFLASHDFRVGLGSAGASPSRNRRSAATAIALQVHATLKIVELVGLVCDAVAKRR